MSCLVDQHSLIQQIFEYHLFHCELQQDHPRDDRHDVVRSEINDIRKSVVSMSVGQPDRTTTIVKEWLEQPEPTLPAEPEQEASSDSDSGDTEEKEK